MPTKSFSGVKVVSPVAGSTSRTPTVSPVTGSVIVIGPVDGSWPFTSVMVNGSFSGSVSFPNKLSIVGWFLVAAIKSSPADGLPFAFGSLGGVTLKVTNAVSVAPLGSAIVYSKVGSPM